MSATGRHVLRLSRYAPALPTPFDDGGELDLPALERLCHRQVESGATALVVCGTTGEAPTLSRAEHTSVVRAAVRASDGRIPVVVPGLCRAMYLASMRGQIAQAQQLAMAVARVSAALQRDSDPAPVKYALSTMDLVSPWVRLPLVELGGESRAEIDAVLARVSEKYPGYLIGKLARRDQTADQPIIQSRLHRKFAVVS